MKAYVLQTGCYESVGVHGVYSTPERAMAAWAPTRWTSGPLRALEAHSYAWSQDADGDWTFGADWDHYATVTAYELDAPERLDGA